VVIGDNPTFIFGAVIFGKVFIV